MKFATFAEVEKFIDEYGSRPVSQNKDYNTAIPHQLDFLELIGNPHEHLTIVHVAGTSGKGSTVALLSNVLISQGFRVGASFSPHIYNFLERIQIGDCPISETLFLHYFNRFFQALETMIQRGVEPSYFELFTALQFFIFSEEKVDYAIIEVGMGGRLDPTNVPVKHKIDIINAIGYDHTRFLGDTLVEIAGEKAGIIQEGNIVVALSQEDSINKVFIRKSESMDANLDLLEPQNTVTNIKTMYTHTSFCYHDTTGLNRTITISLLGDYQAINCALALSAVEKVASRDGWQIDWKRLIKNLENVHFVGRFEIVTLPHTLVILDGAHNGQKMSAFLRNVSTIFPSKKANILLSIKKGKDSEELLKSLLGFEELVDTVYITQFSNSHIHIQPMPVDEIQQTIKGMGSTNIHFVIHPNLKECIIIAKNRHEILLITGSMYLLGEVKKQLKRS